MSRSKSPIVCIGGKSRLANKIIELFPRHRHYVEVFGGSGAILFSKPRSKIETYNDINGELVNFFRVLRDHYQDRKWYGLITPYHLVICVN